MKIFLIVLLAILILIPFVFGIYLIVFNCFYKKYFSNKEQNKKILSSLNEDVKIFDDFEEIKCFSGDRILKGKYKNNGNNFLAILTHSFGQDHRQMAGISKFFIEQGFDILAIDLFSKEKSMCSYGQQEGRDLSCFVERMIEINCNYKIVMFGIGLGGASQLLALDVLPKNVKIIFCESSFDDEKKQLLFTINKSKINQKMFFNFLERSKGLKFEENKIVENIKKSQIPIVVFHDEKDEVVPLQMAYSLQEALPSYNKEIIILKDCGHGEGFEKQNYLLKNSIKKYLKKYNLIN